MFANTLRKLVTGLAAFTMLFIGGCGLFNDAGTGTMEVRLHDAPADYDAVNVFIESVEVNRVGDPDGWVSISQPQQSYNLLELANGAYAVLGEQELEAGTYHQIRLILSRDGHSVVIDSTEHPMTVPSGAQTGIKLEVNAEIEEDIQYTLLLDFDAARSVVQAGQTGNYLLQPVIRANNEATTGNIAGTVSPADAQPIVYAIAGSDTLTSTYADTTDGYFKLIGLESGSYTVSIDPRNTNYQEKNLTDVQVTVGETNDLGTIQLN